MQNPGHFYFHFGISTMSENQNDLQVVPSYTSTWYNGNRNNCYVDCFIIDQHTTVSTTNMATSPTTPQAGIIY